MVFVVKVDNLEEALLVLLKYTNSVWIQHINHLPNLSITNKIKDMT